MHLERKSRYKKIAICLHLELYLEQYIWLYLYITVEEDPPTPRKSCKGTKPRKGQGRTQIRI